MDALAAQTLVTRLRRRLAEPAEAVCGRLAILQDELHAQGFQEAAGDAGRARDAAEMLLDRIAALGALDAHDEARARHDLRTPLNAVIGYSEIVLEDTEDELPPVLEADLRRVLADGTDLLAQIDVLFSPDGDRADDVDADVAAALSRTLTQDTPSGGRRTGRILVIDDTEANRDLMVRQLARQGHRATAVGSAQAGLAALAGEAFDLLLVDVLMPDMNGIELLERLKAHPEWRELPVIIVSGLGETAAITRCLASGAEDYLLKPADPIILNSRVAACLDRLDWQRRERRYLAQIEVERARADALLATIYPAPIIARLQAGETAIADRVEGASVVFADIVGFTALAGRTDPAELIGRLSGIFARFDELAARHGVEKIKTIGDAYMAACGVSKPEADHLACAFAFAENITRAMAEPVGGGLAIRVGLETGPVIAGVMGRMRSVYDVWGETVNVASRLEATGAAGRIHLTEATWHLMGPAARFAPSRRRTHLKGIGEVATVLVTLR